MVFLPLVFLQICKCVSSLYNLQLILFTSSLVISPSNQCKQDFIKFSDYIFSFSVYNYLLFTFQLLRSNPNSSLHYSMSLIPRIHQISGGGREPMYIIPSLSNSQGGTELKWLSQFAKARSLPNAQSVLQHTAGKRK